jgi:serine/threonine-protein kinase ULK/ATG1
MSEISILRRICSPNVIKICDVYRSKQDYNLLMEYCNGGDLENYIKARGGYLVEEEARLILRQIVNGISAIKSNLVMHRDLKPANILIHFSDVGQGKQIDDTAEYCKNLDFKQGHQSIVVKIGDLGLAKTVEEDQQAKTICGSPLFMAPELFEN